MRVGGEVVGEIGVGLCVLLGIAREDGEEEAARLAAKVAKLRIFENDDGKFDRSLVDAGGAALVVSQFTLIADSKRQKGARPDFSKAARPEVAEPLYERFCDCAPRAGRARRDRGVRREDGGFAREQRTCNDHPRRRPRTGQGVARLNPLS